MSTHHKSYSHQVPSPLKIVCSIFMWFPVVISFISLHYLPNITVTYNLLMTLYVIVAHILMYGTSFYACFKQNRTVQRLLKDPSWQQMRRIRSNTEARGSNDVENVLHLVIIPIYKEEPQVIEETLKSLAAQNVSMIIGFTLEEREVNSDTKYDHIIRKYEDKFVKIMKTIHPAGLINEIPGKASNSDYSARALVKHYEENLKDSYDYVMITSCDSDSIWCEKYFLYLNYLCTTNDLRYFDNIAYVPNITNLKHFRSNHILTNWMMLARSIVTHGSFRCLGYVRCCVSEYHVPLKLLKAIDYWDTDLVHEDIHMTNKLMVLDQNAVEIKQTFLPCDNQIPSDPNSIYRSFLLLWNQSLRWNLFLYDLYYLVHQWILNFTGTRNYDQFKPSSRKILKRIIINYENLFLFFMAPFSNAIFWSFYVHTSDHPLSNGWVHLLLNHVQPSFMILHLLLAMLSAVFILKINCKMVGDQVYSWKQTIALGVSFCVFSIVAPLYQCLNVTVAWLNTLKTSLTHSESAQKTILEVKHD